MKTMFSALTARWKRTILSPHYGKSLLVAFLFSFFSVSSVFLVLPHGAHAAPTSYYTYNDTVLIVNDASATSTTIANYFMQARGLASTTWATTHVIHLSATSTPTAESISLSQFNTYIRDPIQNFLISHNLASTTNYIITTKGVPLKIGGTASVDQELQLVLSNYSGSIGSGTWVFNPYFYAHTPFSTAAYGYTHLVTRLTGYTIPQVEALINRSGNATTTNNGQFIFDTAPSRGYTCAQNCSYYSYNLDMEAAATSTLAKGYSTKIDYTNTYLTNEKNVLGYYSWGSNDGNSTTTITGWTPASNLTAATTTFSIGLAVQATTTSGYVYGYHTPAGGIDFGVTTGTPGTIVGGPQTAASSTWWQVAYRTGAIPHNTYVNGAIGDTVVSTSGRTFTWPPVYGQSLTADLIKNGISGVAGYTSEPYLTAVSRPDILFDRYTDGYNLADSFGMAFNFMNWKQVVVGDSKMVIIKHLASSFAVLSPADNSIASSTTVSFSWSPLQDYYGVSKYQLYIDGALAKDNLTATTTTDTLTDGSHTWYVKAYGNDGYATSTPARTLNVVSGYTASHTFYVDNVLGSDSNDGSQAHPWKTLAKAALTVQPGNTIVLVNNPGEPYRLSSTISLPTGTSGAPITLEGEGGPTNKTEIWGSTDESGGWTAAPSPAPAGAYEKTLTTSVVQALFAGSSLDALTSRTKSSSLASLSAGQWYMATSTKTLYYFPRAGENMATLSIEAVETSGSTTGINLSGYNTLKDVVVRYTGGTGIVAGGRDTVENVATYNTGNVGIDVFGPDTTITHSMTIGSAAEGISAEFASNSTLENNLSYGNGGDGFLVRWVGSGLTLINNLAVDNGGNSFGSAYLYSGSPSASHNAWTGTTSASWIPYEGTGNVTLATSTNLFVSPGTGNFSLRPFSPLIDTGTAASTTTDFLGNPIYGTPDIGPLEYEPPYTMGSSTLAQDASIRLYANGKYRYLSATSTSQVAPLTVSPSGGFTPHTYNEILDLHITGWNVGGKRQWSESSPDTSLATTNIVGGLTGGQEYDVLLDGALYATATASANGTLSFTYSGGFTGPHTFTLVKHQSGGFVPVFTTTAANPNPLPASTPPPSAATTTPSAATSTPSAATSTPQTATSTPSTSSTPLPKTPAARAALVHTLQLKLLSLLTQLLHLLEAELAAGR